MQLRSAQTSKRWTGAHITLFILACSSGGGATVATYGYDARSARKTATAGGATTVFVADADDRVVLTYNGATGALQQRLLYGLGIDDAVMVIDAQTGARDSLIPDIQGSVIGSFASTSVDRITPPR